MQSSPTPHSPPVSQARVVPLAPQGISFHHGIGQKRPRGSHYPSIPIPSYPKSAHDSPVPGVKVLGGTKAHAGALRGGRVRVRVAPRVVSLLSLCPLLLGRVSLGIND